MSPRSPIFKTILWKAFSAGKFVGVSVHAGSHPHGYAPVRFYFRSELAHLKFAAKLEELCPMLSRDHKLGNAIGKLSGTLFFVEFPLSCIRQSNIRHPLALPLDGGLRGLTPIYNQLIVL